MHMHSVNLHTRMRAFPSFLPSSSGTRTRWYVDLRMSSDQRIRICSATEHGVNPYNYVQGSAGAGAGTRWFVQPARYNGASDLNKH